MFEKLKKSTFKNSHIFDISYATTLLLHKTVQSYIQLCQVAGDKRKQAMGLIDVGKRLVHQVLGILQSAVVL